jgi:hypothetical protein
MKNLLLVISACFCFACSSNFDHQVNLHTGWLFSPEFNGSTHTSDVVLPEYVFYHKSGVGLGFWLGWFPTYTNFSQNGIDYEEELEFNNIDFHYRYFILDNFSIGGSLGYTQYYVRLDYATKYRYYFEGNGYNLGTSAQYHVFKHLTIGATAKYFFLSEGTDHWSSTERWSYDPSGLYLGFQVGVNF